MPRATTKSGQPLAKVWTSVKRLQRQGEHVVGRLRRDAQTLIARSRAEARKEIRTLERRMLKGLRAATEGQVSRLERRIGKLEDVVADLRKRADDRGF